VGWVRAGIEAPDSGPPLVRGRSLLGGLPTAYVCRNFSCRQPTVDLAQMEAELDAARPQSV